MKGITSMNAYLGKGRLMRLSFRFRDGSEETKMVFPEDFLQMFRAGIFHGRIDRHEFFTLGLIPHGYAGAAVDRFSSGLKVALRVPAGIRPYNYFGATTVIPQPEALALIYADNGVFKDLYVFAVSNDKLFHYPTANIYGDGRVCWGSNPRPEIKKIKDAEKVLPLFYGSEFNNDLYEVGRTVCSKLEFTNPGGLLKALEGRAEFPEEWLVPYDGAVTVNEAISNFLA